MLDRLARQGASPRNNADIGTGTGLLAFAAMALWPRAKVIASDIDPASIFVTRDNAAINHVPLGRGGGRLALAVAPGTDHPAIRHRAPYDLVVAHIRSEERRVGKACGRTCRSRGSPCHYKKK